MKWACFFLVTLLLTSSVSQGEIRSDEPIQPIPTFVDLPKGKVVLGEKLFHDTRLSKDNSVSCASCHLLSMGGVDRRKFSIGVGGLEGGINSPTVFNSGFNFMQFWDGRAKDLHEQAGGPITNPVEMGEEWRDVLKKISKDATYRQLFSENYDEGITPNSIRDAIATFGKSLYTPNSRFDRYLRGEERAINVVERKGYKKFKRYGCISCHQGVNVGGNMFQKIGVIDDFFAGREIKKADLGRYNVTGREEDRHSFKVPSLRNVELTAPYFHDGSAETLEEAVQAMAKYQLGRRIPPKDLEAIIAFLKTLTGQYKGEKLR